MRKIRPFTTTVAKLVAFLEDHKEAIAEIVKSDKPLWRYWNEQPAEAELKKDILSFILFVAKNYPEARVMTFLFSRDCFDERTRSLYQRRIRVTAKKPDIDLLDPKQSFRVTEDEKKLVRNY